MINLERHTIAIPYFTKSRDITYQAYLEYILIRFVLTMGSLVTTFAVRGGKGGQGDHCYEG